MRKKIALAVTAVMLVAGFPSFGFSTIILYGFIFYSFPKPAYLLAFFSFKNLDKKYFLLFTI